MHSTVPPLSAMSRETPSVSDGAALRVAVIGSRGYARLDVVERFVRSLPTGTVLISGGASGVDQMAERTWAACGGEVFSIPANWTALGGGAGILRNVLVVGESARLYAFWDGVSPGTANTIALSHRGGSLRWIAGPDGTRDTERLLAAAWAIEGPKRRVSWPDAPDVAARALHQANTTPRVRSAPLTSPPLLLEVSGAPHVGVSE